MVRDTQSRIQVISLFANSLGVKSFKRPIISRLTQKMKDKRLQFAKDHINWTIGGWKKVLWPDESPFHVFSMPNRQNDRNWARNSNTIEPIFQMKFPTKIQVLDMMSHRALSELHIIPPKQTINGAYYRDNILAKTCSDATNRTADTDPILERSILADMSDFLFMQDDAPPHTANLT